MGADECTFDSVVKIGCDINMISIQEEKVTRIFHGN